MKTKTKVLATFVVMGFVAILLFARSDFALMCRQGLQDESLVAAIWAYLNTGYPPGFRERKFMTIHIGDSEESVLEKIGQPRNNPKLNGDPILWVYGYAAWDNDGMWFYGRNIEFDKAGHVIRVRRYIDCD